MTTLHGLFADQASRTPAAVALTVGGESWTYAELAARVEGLAAHLRRLGVAPGTVVGVSMERTAELPVALLAVLTAGAAYVPLDPAYPAERLAFLLEDTAAGVILTQSHLHHRLPPSGAEVVEVDALGPFEALGGGATACRAGAGDLAYLIFTSGSTGRPKGVAIEHRAAVALVDWARQVFTAAELAGVLASTSINFDLSVFELFLPLAVGGRVLLTENALALGGLPAGSYVTLVNTVPSAARELLRLGALPASVRVVNLAGEPLPRELADEIYALGTVEKLYNLYGPSEDTTYSTWCLVPRRLAGRTPIGRPISGTSVDLRGRRGEPVPRGDRGELLLGGAGLARGYHRRPALTAERFVPDSSGAGGRLYRTGDLAAWRHDGALDFFGRADHQVKIRGFRIELGEIEGALRRHPEVRDAVAAARPDAAGELRLVAYVVGEQGLTPPADGVRAHLRSTLPEHMVPAVFVALEEIPLTLTGKVDRAALPEPEMNVRAAGTAFVAPRTATERALAAIWSEALGGVRVGAEDRFLDLGGHSLQAARVVARLRRDFRVDLDPRRFFDHPSVASLAGALDAGRFEVREEAPIEPLERPLGDVPLSTLQEEVWLTEAWHPGTAMFNVAIALELDGPLDEAVLAAAAAALVRRHETLRTVFVTVDDVPVQRVRPAAGLGVHESPLALVDLASLPWEVARATARRLARREGKRPIDPHGEVLYRFVLARLAAHEHLLVVNLHHLVSDGWSETLAAGELAALYRAAVSRPAAPPERALPALPFQYPDYAVRQRRFLDERGDVLLAYWRERLAGDPGAFELAGDRPRPGVKSFRGARESTVFPAELDRSLAELAAAGGATRFVALLSVFYTLLARYTGSTDVIAAAPVAARQETGVEGLIGLFTRNLILRADLGGAPTFREVLEHVRRVTADGLAHQDVPLGALINALVSTRDNSRNPLFQLMLNLQDSWRLAGELAPGIAYRGRELDTGTAKVDLALLFEAGEDGVLEMIAEYAPELYDATTVRRFLRHYQRLAAAAVADPDRRLAELRLLAAAERHQLVDEWNDTRTAWDGAGDELAWEPTLHRLIELRTARSPEAIALIEPGADGRGERLRMTRGELLARSRRLARRLRELGAGPEAVVGVHLTRDAELVVTVLAVLEAGAAYLPLEPDLPPERLSYMLESSGAAALVSRSELAGKLPETALPVLFLDCEGERLASLPDEPLADGPPLGAGPKNLAYVIYTSGSTGRPKGAMNTHEAVVNRLLWMQRAYPLEESDRVFHKTPFSFDVSVWELFWPQLAGAPMVIARPEGHRDPAYLARVIEEHRVTTLHFVPSMLDAFLEQPDLEARCRSLGRVIASGEALNADHERRYHARLGAPLHNLYGPTEAAIDVTFQPAAAAGRNAATVPIGRPIANTRVRVLDRSLRPPAVGFPGQLFIAGVNLARGYRGRPRLTAERFLPDPHGDGERLYATGDEVRLLADGALEFLGRIDFQVKIRGLRIELGEIESVLADHPSVRRAVVAVCDLAPAGPTLVAHVVSADGSADTAELGRFLGSKLPTYMVPHHFVFLDELPTTGSGKVDRKALPAPEIPAVEGGSRPPSTPVEEILAGFFRELLDRKEVGVDQDFFRLGGHSLLAVQLTSRISDVFGVELSLRDALARGTTVAGLAAAVAEARERPGTVMSPIEAVPRPFEELPSEELPLSFSQLRLWFLVELEPEATDFVIPLATRLSGPLDVDALAGAFAAVVRRHETLRTRFTNVDGEPRQVVEAPVATPLPLRDLSPAGDGEAALRRLAEEQAGRSFDLDRPPLVRLTLARLAPEEHVLLMAIHHVISDGWSNALLLRELAEHYGGLVEDRPPEVPELPVQYADYAAWQRRHLTGEVLEKRLSHWRRRLAGMPPVLELPTDRPRPAVLAPRTGREPLSFGPGEPLTRFADHRGATLFTVLLAAFQALLGRLARQRDFGVGTYAANRGRVEIEPLIGFFVNTLVLRADLRGRPSFAELVARTRDSALGAFDHQDLPFERLLEELEPERDPSRTPLFQVLCVFQSFAAEKPSAAGVTFEPIEVGDGGRAHFDLSLWVWRDEERLTGLLEFNRDLFDRTTIRRLGGHLRRLLAESIADAERPVEEASLLSAAELHQLLEEWNPPPRPPADPLVHELFAERARRTPAALAVVGENRDGAAVELTYGELHRRADFLAARLAARRVRPGTVVAIAMERGPGMVVAVLGVLAAGGAYLPLDPSHPDERLASLLADAAPPVLLTQARLATRFEAPCFAAFAGEVATLDDAARTGTALHGPGALPRPASAAHPVYVIYTSGSTGRPKGVTVEHRALASYVRAARRAFALTPADRVLQFASLAFDASAEEIFLTLASGATLVLRTDRVLASPETFLADCARQGVTVLDLPTAYWHQLVARLGEEAAPALPESLRLVILGGERALPERVAAWRGAVGERPLLLNTYGPTEATIVATLEPLSGAAACHMAGREVPIGRPLGETRAFVLGPGLQPAPAGAPGELYLAGPTLARGYRGRPARTAASFVPSPYPRGPGERTYRTGDLVRRFSDGRLEYLGRVDFQVKVRGHRIELGEIEAALAEMPGVERAAVVAREKSPGELTLVAYVAAPSSHVTAVSLRDDLKRSLPSYMVPTTFVVLEALPETRGGKVDRGALPGPEGDLSRRETWVAPEGVTEETLASIWVELLDLRRVGAEDDFFDLGGHSLLVPQLLARVEKAFGVALPVRSLFDSPTLAELALTIEETLLDEIEALELAADAVG